MRAAFRILLFMLIGPPVGAVAYLSATGLYSFVSGGRVDDLRIVGEMLVSPMILAFSYVTGGLPALLTGVAAAALVRGMAPGWQYRGVVMGVGFLASATCVLLVFWPSVTDAGGRPDRMWDPVYFLAAMGATGALSALICLLLFDALSRRIWRNS
jgi:hypothetical protein